MHASSARDTFADHTLLKRRQRFLSVRYLDSESTRFSHTIPNCVGSSGNHRSRRRNMLHSGTGSVHFPVYSSRADRRPLQRGRLQVSAAIKKGKEKNVVCTKQIVAKQETAEIVERMCRDIMDFSHGKQKVKSSGIMEFGVSRDQFEPNVFHTWERYDSNASLGRHNTCPEFQAFMENIQTHLEGPIGIALYEWKDGQIGAVSMQGGIKGEGGLDDATGAGGTGASRMTQTSATVDLGHTKREDDGLWGMGFKFPWQKKKDSKK